MDGIGIPTVLTAYQVRGDVVPLAGFVITHKLYIFY